jgi:hypothetical protein
MQENACFIMALFTGQELRGVNARHEADGKLGSVALAHEPFGSHPTTRIVKQLWHQTDGTEWRRGRLSACINDEKDASPASGSAELDSKCRQPIGGAREKNGARRDSKMVSKTKLNERSTSPNSTKTGCRGASGIEEFESKKLEKQIVQCSSSSASPGGNC